MSLSRPGGQPDPLLTKSFDWSVADGADKPRDDTDYITRVIADATARLGVDHEKIVLAGNLRGGSMVRDVVCASPGQAQAFASYFGVFRDPMAETCAGGTHLFHSHGVEDKTVSIAGRKLEWQGEPFEQGDIPKWLGIWWQSLSCIEAAEPVNDAIALRMTRWRD
ncbi:MAG: hypothetical protein AAGK37_09260 [Pseudomonadota bacterium]